MATLQDFYPWVRLDCPGVPDPAMDDAIRKGAREFCRLTGALEVDVPVATAVAQPDYTLVLPDYVAPVDPLDPPVADVEIITVSFVRASPTEVLTSRTLDYIESQPAASGVSRDFAMVETDPLSIRLYPTPDAVRTLTARFTVMPTPSATDVDGKLLSWYQEGVTAYAKYYLMSQPAKPWTNVEQAAFEFRRFDNSVSDTRIRRSQGRAGIANSVVMTPFA